MNRFQPDFERDDRRRTRMRRADRLRLVVVASALVAGWAVALRTPGLWPMLRGGLGLLGLAFGFIVGAMGLVFAGMGLSALIDRALDRRHRAAGTEATDNGWPWD